MDLNELWILNRTGCPWYDMGDCLGKKEYDPSTNEQRYVLCTQVVCPIFYWVEKLEFRREFEESMRGN